MLDFLKIFHTGHSYYFLFCFLLCVFSLAIFYWSVFNFTGLYSAESNLLLRPASNFIPIIHKDAPPLLTMRLRADKPIVSEKMLWAEHTFNAPKPTNHHSLASPVFNVLEPTVGQYQLTHSLFYNNVLNISCNLLRVLLSHHYKVEKL